MKRYLAAVLLAALALSLPSSLQAQSQEDRGYGLIADPFTFGDPGPDGIELAFLFWYGCPTCRAIDKNVKLFLESLGPDVKVRRLPAVYKQNIPWMTHGRLFFALEALGREEELHSAVFEAVQNRTDGGHGAGLLDLAEIESFVRSKGIDPEEFKKAWNSPETDLNLERAAAFLDNSKMDGVPGMIIGGRYQFMIGPEGEKKFYQTAEELIGLERERLAKKSPPPVPGP
jgi:thiol:disulfide interchange protein DsbA